MKKAEFPNGSRVYNIDTDQFGYIISSRHMFVYRKRNRHNPYVYKIRYGDMVITDKTPTHLCSGEIQPNDPRELAVGRRFTERTVRFFKGTAGYLDVFPFEVGFDSVNEKLWFDIEWPVSGQVPHLHVWRSEIDAINWGGGFSLLLGSNTSYEHDLSTIAGTNQEELDTINIAFTAKVPTDDGSEQTLWERFMSDLSDAGDEYVKYRDYKFPPTYDIQSMNKVYTL